ncbi:MAG: dihydrodipicolinate synthase family protein [Lachnospiraceae bacterium]
MHNKLSGIIIPAITPFDRDGSLDFEMMKGNYDKWNQTDVRGYMCLGSNGEFKSLNDEESYQVIAHAAEYHGKDKTLIAGVGRESLHHTLEFIERINREKLKLDYLSVLTPSYFAKRMTDEALVNYYVKIADYSNYPILLYCAPSFANSVCLSVDAVRELAGHPNIHGIKDTSGHMMDEYMFAFKGRTDFEVLAGSINTILNCMEQGGKGGVISVANYFPEYCTKFMGLFRKGKRTEAKSYLEKLKGAAQKTGARQSVASIKCCMNLMGYQGGYPREPMLPVDSCLKAELRQAIEESRELLV